MVGKSWSKSPHITAAELLRQVALDCALGDPGDPATAEKVRDGLTRLLAALVGSALEPRAHLALELLGPAGSAEERVGLARVADVIDQLQADLARNTVADEPSVSAESPAASEPPLAAQHGSSLSPPGPARPSILEQVRAAASAPPSAARDAEMVELFGDFVAESLEGLDRAEAILLAAEQSVIDSEGVNALFRVFHSIKGVSGFLSVAEVTRLAHVTEALLDQVRQGKLVLTGDALDAVFEASARMRRTLETLRKTVPQGLPDPRDPNLPTLLARIERASLGETGSSNEASSTQEDPPRSDVETTALETTALDDPEPGTRSKSTEGNSARVRDTVKVDLERVDSIVEMVGELIIVESMVVNAPELAQVLSAKLRNYLNQLTKISRDLQNASMSMRMVPVSGVFRKMARLVRDLSRSTGKLVQLVQSGETTEMDRSMVERIEEPLVHMIRNAIDHAIEPPDERRSVGKSPTATILLSAAHEGGSVAIGLRDDGRGLPREKILKKARERELITDSGETLSDQEVYSLIFVPGFSTASQVTEISGRGVGMDVVKRSVEDMRGRVLVDSTRGQGTTFKLVLPLTLAIIDGMLVACGPERYIIPSLSIIESLQPTREMVHSLGDGSELITVRGEILPLMRLGTLFGVPGASLPAEQILCVILESAGRKLGLLVDDIVTQQQVVIKPLGDGLGNTELLAGAAILPDGQVGFILNVDRLGEQFSRRRHGSKEVTV